MSGKDDDRARSPDVPAERVSELRAAFNATMADPEFLADACKLGAEIGPLPADELKKDYGENAEHLRDRFGAHTVH